MTLMINDNQMIIVFLKKKMFFWVPACGSQILIKLAIVNSFVKLLEGVSH